MAKALIAYFSRADENYFGGAMRYVKVGNTEIVCNLMKELIDADSFKIPGLSQLLGHHADGGVHVPGGLRLFRQDDPAPVHQ